MRTSRNIGRWVGLAAAGMIGLGASRAGAVTAVAFDPDGSGPLGTINLVAFSQNLMSDPQLIDLLQQQADKDGQTVRLVRFIRAEEVLEVPAVHERFIELGRRTRGSVDPRNIGPMAADVLVVAAGGGSRRCLNVEYAAGPQARVVQAEDAAPLLRQPLAFEPPCARDAAGHLAPHEAVDALAHARAGMVFRRRHPAVVSASMLDGEVPVHRHREHQTRQPLLEQRVLVAELVAGVDAQAPVMSGIAQLRAQADHGADRIAIARQPGEDDHRMSVATRQGRHAHPAHAHIFGGGS